MSPDTRPAPMSPDAMRALLPTLFAPWVQALGLSVDDTPTDAGPAGDAGQADLQLHLPVTPAVVHAGGVVCGQALMAAADTAAVLALARHLGGFRPMSTVQLQTAFLRAVPAGTPALAVRARVLKCGRRLAFVEVGLHLPGGALAAQATATCALEG